MYVTMAFIQYQRVASYATVAHFTYYKLKYSAGRSTGYQNEGYLFHYCGYTKTCPHTHTHTFIYENWNLSKTYAFKEVISFEKYAN